MRGSPISRRRRILVFSVTYDGSEKVFCLAEVTKLLRLGKTLSEVRPLNPDCCDEEDDSLHFDKVGVVNVPFVSEIEDK